MGLERLGLIIVVNNRTLCVWIIRGGCKPNDVVERVTFVPCHFCTSVSSFRIFGMLCYLISTLVTNNAGVGFDFQEFDGECRASEMFGPLKCSWINHFLQLNGRLNQCGVPSPFRLNQPQLIQPKINWLELVDSTVVDCWLIQVEINRGWSYPVNSTVFWLNQPWLN